MNQLSITLKSQTGEVKHSLSDEKQIIFVYRGEYEPGDSLVFHVETVPHYYVIRVDDTMDEALVYLTEQEITYQIPFEEKRISYNPKSFIGDRHYVTIREAESYEIHTYRNLAKNVMDQHENCGCYPHASANVETRGEAVFAARNAIDGVLANDSHGKWPYESWGINQQDDAAITIDFGRPVEFDRITLYTRADFPHDNWWEEATLSFSDGSEQIIRMEKSDKPHNFVISKKGISWIRMSHMVKADDPSPFPALTQIEVYGI